VSGGSSSGVAYIDDLPIGSRSEGVTWETETGHMRFSVLGPLQVLDDQGEVIELGGRQPRATLAVLLAAAGRPVSVESLIDAIWGPTPPASAAGTLQSYVSRLRRRVSPAELVFDDVGYRLVVPADDVDHLVFEQLADEGRARLDAHDPTAARAALLEAEALWRGPALTEFAELDVVVGTATRLEQRRLSAIEDRLDADLALGRHAAAVAELTELVAANPLRERLQEQLAIALYRSGRQAEALRSLAEAGRTLREELGIEPSRELRELEAAILAHDPALDLPPSVAALAPPGTSPPSSAPSAGQELPAPQGPSARPALVGRGHELAELVAALAESDLDTRFVVIEGEPGIGKTRLADELRTIAAGAPDADVLAVWGRSDEGGAAPALWPWLAPLRAVAAVAGQHGDVPPAVADLLAGSVEMAAGQARAAQFERFEAVATLLEVVASSRPVVVLLDDLQWADATSLELLAFLAGRSTRGVLVVGTVRQLEVGRNDAVTETLAAIARRPGSRRLVVRGLDRADTADLLEAAANHAVSAADASAIHARADGNPFYAIELARLLDEEGDSSDEIPGGVGDVIRRRLARLPEPSVELLGVAAVVGREVDLQLLAVATDSTLGEVLDRLEPAVVHRLLVDAPDQPGPLRFSHALVREVLLDDLTSLRRARLHLQVADAMVARGAGVDDAEILAEHLWRAVPVGVGGRAAEALERAAEVAVRRVAYAAAEDLLTRAVQLRRSTGSTLADEEAELRALFRLLEVARARRYFQGAAAPEVIDRAKELAERTGQRDLLLDLMWFEWSSRATAARTADSTPLAEAYQRLTRDDPRPEVQAAGWEVRGVWCWGAGRIGEAVESLERAMALTADLPAPADEFGAEQRMVSVTFALLNHALHGDVPVPEVFARFDELMASIPDRFGVASVCGFAATTAIALGDWEQAERFAATGADANRTGEFTFWVGQTLMQRGIVQVWRGTVDEGVADFTTGRDIYTGIGGRSALSTFEASLALNLIARGRVAEARRSSPTPAPRSTGWPSSGTSRSSRWPRPCWPTPPATSSRPVSGSPRPSPAAGSRAPTAWRPAPSRPPSTWGSPFPTDRTGDGLRAQGPSDHHQNGGVWCAVCGVRGMGV
jgi:DNA-binding SARP family transcriptional activator